MRLIAGQESFVAASDVPIPIPDGRRRDLNVSVAITDVGRVSFVECRFTANQRLFVTARSVPTGSEPYSPVPAC